MEIRFNVTGAARKAFVTLVGDLVGWEPVYKKAPTFAYVVNNLTIDKEGTLIFPDGMDLTEAAQLLEALAAQGYVSEDSISTAVCRGEDTAEKDAAALAEESDDMNAKADAPITAFPGSVADFPGVLTIAMPRRDFTLHAYSNLLRLVESKASLLCQSIGGAELLVHHDEERVYFPWFAADSTPEEVCAYTQLVSALCEMAKTQQRVTATNREVENPKYAMRCFLLRLGFIGEEFAAARKLLLKNLSGNGSFKGRTYKEAPEIASTGDENVNLKLNFGGE